MKKIFQLLIISILFVLPNQISIADCPEDGSAGDCLQDTEASAETGNESSNGVVNPQNDLSKESFMINVGEITPGGGNVSSALGSGDVNEKATNLLEVIISILILPFGVLAIISMTIGGGIMIFSGGKDELLTRGKTLFKGSLIALSIALLSGVVMQLISNLLFK